MVRFRTFPWLAVHSKRHDKDPSRSGSSCAREDMAFTDIMGRAKMPDVQKMPLPEDHFMECGSAESAHSRHTSIFQICCYCAMVFAIAICGADPDAVWLPTLLAIAPLDPNASIDILGEIGLERAAGGERAGARPGRPSGPSVSILPHKNCLVGQAVTLGSMWVSGRGDEQSGQHRGCHDRGRDKGVSRWRQDEDCR